MKKNKSDIFLKDRNSPEIDKAPILDGVQSIKKIKGKKQKNQ